MKIYLEADDPDGNMLKLVTVADMVAYGHYPADVVYLKGQNQKHFIGYLQWNTYGNTSLSEWTEVTLKMSVLDKSGRESNVVVFPITFQMGYRDTRNPPPPFNQANLQRLGYIDIRLVDPRRPEGNWWPND